MLNISNVSTENDDFESGETLESFVIQVPTVDAGMLGKDLKELFTEKSEAEGVVVLEGSIPLGIIMRTTFYQKLSSLYGNSLFMGRPIGILMDTEMLTVDIKDTVSDIGIRAMKRPQGKLYDYIIALNKGNYAGVICIRQFLMTLSKKNAAQINVLKLQQKKLIEAHKLEVDLRTNLINKSHSVKNLLDHAGQGFLLFGNDFIIKDEFSVECTRIFNKSIAGDNYLELIGKHFSEDLKSTILAALNGYFSNTSPVTDNVYLMLLPSEVLIEDKNIHFEYKRIENGAEKSVMVILNDITGQKAMEKTVEQEHNNQRLVIKALTHQGQIRQMIESFIELCESGFRSILDFQPDFKTALNELYRTVHTFKGDFAQYGFVRSSEKLHIFEDKLYHLINIGDSSESEDIDSLISSLASSDILKEDLKVIASVLGKGFFEKDETISILQSRLLELEHAVLNGPETPNKQDIYVLLKSLMNKNIKAFLNQYEDYLNYLSGRLLKKMPVYIVEGDDILIDPNEYNTFLRSLVHIYRNIMDHGLETDEERLSCGKPEQGVVLCRIKKNEEKGFTFSISDDGRGIDTDKIRSKALANPLLKSLAVEELSEQELMLMIFQDHFTTKDKVDTLSGRGVGMAAVKDACEKLGGSIEVTSVKGNGTTFTFILPDLHHY